MSPFRVATSARSCERLAPLWVRPGAWTVAAGCTGTRTPLIYPASASLLTVATRSGARFCFLSLARGVSVLRIGAHSSAGARVWAVALRGVMLPPILATDRRLRCALLAGHGQEECLITVLGDQMQRSGTIWARVEGRRFTLVLG